ncbi:MAG TPA: hypothetical protein DCP28_30175, partial [Cytophagales bacterium]|nr:hypothetical protein [Cytophagales bacterium]
MNQGTTYFYYVTATNTAGTSAASNTLSAAPIAPPVSNGPELDVVTFNIEWLGAPSKAGLSMTRDQQLTDAALDILDANADIFALQEIVIDPVNGDALADLLTKLNSLDTDTWAGGYNTYFSYWWSPDFNSFPAQRQAYVYRTSTVSNVSFQTLLTGVVPSGDNRFASGRLPFMMSATVTIDGASTDVNLINLHLKCCTGNTSRRQASMQTLDAELDANWANANVIVLGDMNVADNGGANGEMANWGLYDDSNNDSQPDYAHAAGAVQDLAWDDIDHILISDELTDEYAATDAQLRNVTLSTRSSDHDPIKTTLTLQAPVADTEAPATVTGLASSNVSYDSFTLSWSATTDNVGVAGYEVFQDGSSIGTTTGTSLSVTGLAAETSFAYTVTASDAAGNTSAASGALSVTTTAAPDTEAPTVVTGLASTNLSETGFTLSWAATTDNVGVIGYEVFQDGNSLGTTTGTSLSVTGLTASTTYAYSVTAADAAGNTSAASAALNVTTSAAMDTEAPAVVVDLTSASITESGFTLAWPATIDNVGVIGYEVYQDGSSIGTTTSTSMIVSGLAASTTYSYTVTASDAAGNTSAASTALNVTTADPTPMADALYFSEYIEGSSYNKGLEIANSTGTSIDLSGYYVARQVNGAGNWATPFNLTGSLENGHVYVIAHTSSDAAMQAVADVTTGADALNFNGNDAVGLFFNGELLDIIGTFNSSANFGKDVTLRRNDNITEGNTAYTTSEWASYGSDDFAGLGERSTFIDNQAPTTPLGLTAYDVLATELMLSWNAASDNVGVTAYEVFQDGTSIGTTASTSLAVSGLTGATTYTFTVTASDAAGNTSA